MAHNKPIRGAGTGIIGRNPAAKADTAPEIPDKLYFRIGDVARLCDVPAYVLRFWETEFPQLKPNKGGTGQRLYRRRDVELALTIRRLLYNEGYTIPGARQFLKADSRQAAAPQLSLLGPEPLDTQRLKRLKRELEVIAAMLSRPVGAQPRSSRTQRRAASLQPARPRQAPNLAVVPSAELSFELIQPSLELAEVL